MSAFFQELDKSVVAEDMQPNKECCPTGGEAAFSQSAPPGGSESGQPRPRRDGLLLPLASRAPEW